MRNAENAHVVGDLVPAGHLEGLGFDRFGNPAVEFHLPTAREERTATEPK